MLKAGLHVRAFLLIVLALPAVAFTPSLWLTASTVLPSVNLRGAAEPKALALFEQEEPGDPALSLALPQHQASTGLTRTLLVPTPSVAPTNEDCAPGMLLIEGQYCPKVEHRCKRWMDPEGPYRYFRCAEYEQPARCKAPLVKMRYCIDRDEHTPTGQILPENNRSLSDAVRSCSAEGKRVCRESEWNFACEGEEMRPYPYGFVRDASACNADHTDLVTPGGKLKDLRAPSDAHPRCESPFGVRNLTGNLEEMVARDGPGPMRAAMKGAYWQPSRNHCRAAQTAHDAYYHGTETGFRCCGDAP